MNDIFHAIHQGYKKVELLGIEYDISDESKRDDIKRIYLDNEEIIKKSVIDELLESDFDGEDLSEYYGKFKVVRLEDMIVDIKSLSNI